MATVGGKLFYTSNSKKFMNRSCTNIQFSEVLKEQPQPKARAPGPYRPRQPGHTLISCQSYTQDLSFV